MTQDGFNRVRFFQSPVAEGGHSIEPHELKDDTSNSNLLNNRFVGVFRCGLRTGVITFINSKALDLLSVKKIRCGKLNLFEILEKGAVNPNPLQEEIEKREFIENFETEYAADGKRRWLSFSCEADFQSDCIDGFITDITEKKKRELDLISLREEMDRFIYHTSHQLRSPISSILGITHLLSKENFSVESIMYSNMIEGQARHLDNLFKELMHVYLNNQQKINYKQIDLHSLLTDVVAGFSPFYPAVAVIREEHLSFPFYSDLIRLKLILRNLISNAFKFQKSFSSEQRVKIQVQTTADELTIAVEDNGVGIDPALYQNDIFKIFFKGSEISKKGFGMGLYLVKNVVHKLDGTILVQSQPDEGSTFVVTIPNAINTERNIER